MGLLDAFVQYVKDAMPGGLLNPEVGQHLQNVGNNIVAGHRRQDNVRKGLLADPMNRELQKQAVRDGLDVAGMAPLGMTAWHGSPHKFDKFSLDKIGTGEGSQAFGHGLYLAEAPEVARQYQAMANKPGLRNSTAKDSNTVIDGIIKLSAKKYTDGDVLKLAELVKDRPSAFDKPELILQRISQYDGNNVPSYMYKTDIPDEAVARFLDWNKPLSQQAPEVQAALKSMTDDVSKGGFDLSRSPRNVARAFDDSSAKDALNVLRQKYGVTNSGGQYFDKNGNPVPADAVQRHIDKIAGKGYDNAGQLYSDLMHIIGSQSDISATLRNNGIPGIRYLDGGSRSAGQGSSNFVVFSPDMIRIIERNGVPTGLQPWKPGEYGLLGGVK